MKKLLFLLFFLNLYLLIPICVLYCQNDPCFFDSGLGYNVYSFYLINNGDCILPISINGNPTILDTLSFDETEIFQIIKGDENYTLTSNKVNIYKEVDICVQSPTFGLNGKKCIGNATTNLKNIDILQKYSLNNFLENKKNDIDLNINIKVDINETKNYQYFTILNFLVLMKSNFNGILNTGTPYTFPPGIIQFTIDQIILPFTNYLNIIHINYNEQNNVSTCGYYQIDINQFHHEYIIDCSNCNIYGNTYEIKNIPTTNMDICNQLNINQSAIVHIPASFSITMNVLLFNTLNFNYLPFPGYVLYFDLLTNPYQGNCLIKPINPTYGKILICDLYSSESIINPVIEKIYNAPIEIYQDYGYVPFSCNSLSLVCRPGTFVKNYFYNDKILIIKNQNQLHNTLQQVYNGIGWWQLFYQFTSSLFWTLFTIHSLVCILFTMIMLIIFWYCIVKPYIKFKLLTFEKEDYFL